MSPLSEETATGKMVETLEGMQSKGWHVLSIMEAAYSGELPTPFHSDAGSVDPQNVAHIQFILPHGDHFHIYTYVLIKPELDTHKDTLTTLVLGALKSMDMDVRSTVATEGNA